MKNSIVDGSGRELAKHSHITKIIKSSLTSHFFFSHAQICIALFLVFCVDRSSFATIYLGSCAGYDVKGAEVLFRTGDYSANGEKIEIEVEEADPHTFAEIHDHTLKSSENNNCRNNIPFDNYYGKDRAHVYFKGKIIKGANPSNFSFINEYYARDNKSVYHDGKRISFLSTKFHLLGDPSGKYAADDATIYFEGNKIDATDFRFVSQDFQYAKSAKAVYFNGSIILGAEPLSFSVLNSALGISRDKHQVFYNGKIIPNADPNSFVQVDDSSVFKDMRAVYYFGAELVGINPAFVRVSEFESYVLDDMHVYSLMNHSDGSGFAILREGRDAGSFHELAFPWTKDKKSVYYREEPLSEADPATFMAVRNNHGEDKYYQYEANKRVCKIVEGLAGDLPICNKNK